MRYVLLDAFEVSKYITHPISLVAYLGAAIMTYLITRNVNERKKIAAVKEEDRAKVIIQTAERLHLDIYSVPESERASLVRQVLRNRIYFQLIACVVILILGFLFAWLVSKKTGCTCSRSKTQIYI